MEHQFVIKAQQLTVKLSGNYGTNRRIIIVILMKLKIMPGEKQDSRLSFRVRI